MFGIIREESQAKYPAPCSCITDPGGEENDTGRRSSPLMPREPVDASRASGGGGGWNSFTQVQEGWRGRNRYKDGRRANTSGDQRSRWLTHTHILPLCVLSFCGCCASGCTHTKTPNPKLKKRCTMATVKTCCSVAAHTTRYCVAEQKNVLYGSTKHTTLCGSAKIAALSRPNSGY